MLNAFFSRSFFSSLATLFRIFNKSEKGLVFNFFNTFEASLYENLLLLVIIDSKKEYSIIHGAAIHMIDLVNWILNDKPSEVITLGSINKNLKK